MIGQGGMGAVYEAKHTTLDRKVAVKVLTPGKDDDQQLAIERFLREARAAAALDHPNIVRLHDVGQFGNTHYLVMEYVDGAPLDRACDERRLDIDARIAHANITDSGDYIRRAVQVVRVAHDLHVPPAPVGSPKPDDALADAIAAEFGLSGPVGRFRGALAQISEE